MLVDALGLGSVFREISLLDGELCDNTPGELTPLCPLPHPRKWGPSSADGTQRLISRGLSNRASFLPGTAQKCKLSGPRDHGVLNAQFQVGQVRHPQRGVLWAARSSPASVPCHPGPEGTPPVWHG